MDEIKSKFKPSMWDLYYCRQLMSALNSIDVNIAQFWFKPIKECLDYFELPDEVCDACKKIKMSFWDYHLAQGMCDTCAQKYSRDDEG